MQLSTELNQVRKEEWKWLHESVARKEKSLIWERTQQSLLDRRLVSPTLTTPRRSGIVNVCTLYAAPSYSSRSYNLMPIVGICWSSPSAQFYGLRIQCDPSSCHSLADIKYHAIFWSNPPKLVPPNAIWIELCATSIKIDKSNQNANHLFAQNYWLLLFMFSRWIWTGIVAELMRPSWVYARIWYALPRLLGMLCEPIFIWSIKVPLRSNRTRRKPPDSRKSNQNVIFHRHMSVTILLMTIIVGGLRNGLDLSNILSGYCINRNKLHLFTYGGSEP